MYRYLALLCLPIVVARDAAAQRPAHPTIDTINHHIVRLMNSRPN
jgi:hypothetical protein